jgi:hypothetical protein
MSIENESIKVDYTTGNFPEAAKNFRPDVFKDEEGFYCILGTDPATRVTGRGETVEAALADWDKNYQSKQRKV